VRHVENFHTAGKLGFVLCVKESSFRRSEQLGVVCAALRRCQGFPSSKRQPTRDDVVEDFPLFRKESGLSPAAAECRGDGSQVVSVLGKRKRCRTKNQSRGSRPKLNETS
jgi:hypothetical protein